MRRKKIQVKPASVLAILLFCSLGVGCLTIVQADTATTPAVVISQLKITSSNGQFVTLYNATNATVNLNNYQLQYFNSFDLSKATSSKLIALTGTIPSHGYYVVNDGALTLCYQQTVDSVSLGLSSTAGLVELVGFNQAGVGGLISSSLQDYVGWSKTAAVGAQTLPSSQSAFLQRTPVNAQNNPAVASPGSGNWQAVQPDGSNVCGLITVSSTNGSSTPIASSLDALLPASEPPVTILADASLSSSPVPTLPTSDVGLMAPQITELLPNPSGTGNDAADEFIELYNANNTAFDLTGFSLQTGTTTLHNYTLPAGSSLPANSFVAFYSATTSLSMSNSGGQAKLLDPFGSSISSSAVYGTAADGQSWALAKGNWEWTLTPTPNAANIITAPPVKQSSAPTAKKKTGSSAIATKTAPRVPAASTAGFIPDAVQKTPIHTWILVLVAGAALSYGLYEYRTDLANRFIQFRKYVGNRFGNRQ